MLGFNKIPLYGVFILTFGGALVFALIVRFVFVPWLKNKITLELSESEEPIVKFHNGSDEKLKKGQESVETKEESNGFEAIIDFHDDSGIFVTYCFIASVHSFYMFGIIILDIFYHILQAFYFDKIVYVVHGSLLCTLKTECIFALFVTQVY